MGTPDFAVSTLEALHEQGHEILAAVSQPDKPQGRHAELKPTPVKEKAMELGIRVMQPVKASDPDFINEIRAMQPELIVVTAYGKILKKELLDIPRYGCINVHASLLPRWRGAAPIQWSIIAGDKETGVTAMQMNEGLDTGDILMQRSFSISPEETGGSLFDRLAALGGELIKETITALEAGQLKAVPQPETGCTYASQLSKETGHIDWSRSAAEVDCLIRGLDPWPGTYTVVSGKLLKIRKAEPVSELPAELKEKAEGRAAGSFITSDNDLYAVCGDGGLMRLKEIQLEGKKAMSVPDFLRGSRSFIEKASKGE